MNHRCLGLLPAVGGTRIWQMCDNRSTQFDTTSSFTAFALDSTGRLLYSESTTPSNDNLIPLSHVTLWLADTTHPFTRTPILRLPTTVGSTSITWLSDLVWTGPGSFIGLGQLFGTVPHCGQCLTRDTLFVDTMGVVFRGTISGGQATLTEIAGTEGAIAYSLAEQGATVVFARKNRRALFRVPVSGGSPVPPVPTGPEDSVQIAGVSCKGLICIAAEDSVELTGRAINTTGFICCQAFAHLLADTMTLHRVDLGTGDDEVITLNGSRIIYATPVISPANGDVVVQVGGTWGHLQTFATAVTGNLFAMGPRSDLYLLPNIVR
ncbi:MAG: hypothetical protein ACREL5_11300 [Gemmatimonadales bacterium]